MQSVVENLGGLSKKIRITVPQEQIKDEVEKRIKEIAKTAVIKGFRKGKVKPAVVKLQYGEAVRREVIQDLMVQTLQQAFEEKKIYPAGMPQIELKNAKENEPLEYEAIFEVFPEVKVDLEGISVEKPNTKIGDHHVDDVIEKLRYQNVKWNKVDRAAEKSDLVVIDFEGRIDDELFEGGTAKDFRLELGKGNMIPGFEEPLYGAKAGDQVEVQVTFPADYHAKQYAGKPAKFAVTVHEVNEGELPELNDAFAVDLGVSDGTLAGLRKEVRENLERELARRIHERVKNQIIEKVLEKNTIEVPQASVDEEITRLQKSMQKQFSNRMEGKNLPALTLPRENFAEQARKNVILGLLFSQWINDNQIKVDATRVRDRVDQIASGYHQPHEIVNWYYSNKEALNEIEASVLEEQAIDKILESVQVVETDVSFDELMNLAQQGEK